MARRARSQAKHLELAPAAERPLDLKAHELTTVALALSTGLGVQAALDPNAVPRDLYERVIAGLAGTPSVAGPDSRGR